MLEADFHNFGQSVQRAYRSSGYYFRKPRPVFWEWLFFAKNSPLSPFFSFHSSGYESPGNTFFNLDIENESCPIGFSKEVVSDFTGPFQDSHYYSLGALLGYTYALGIRDLHKANVITMKHHIQIVDVEVVFASLLLPNETLLLPFKEIGVESCGAQGLLNDGVSTERLALILAGYFDVFESLFRNRERIIDVFDDLDTTIRTIPIRHILRDTFRYRASDRDSFDPPLLSAENRQLDRGDIPYFFKLLGQPEVFEYVDRNGAIANVELQEPFLRGAAREAISPKSLLEQGRLDALRATGILYLVKKLSISSKELKIDHGNYCVEKSESEIKLVIDGRSFQSALR